MPDIRKYLFLLLPALISWGEESFITQYEYGKMLYENPRGIGCHHCHGDKGEGQIIASYRHKKKNRQLSAPRINNLTFREFRKPFYSKNSSKKVMPVYHLTDKEIQALYEFLHQSPKNSQ